MTFRYPFLALALVLPCLAAPQVPTDAIVEADRARWERTSRQIWEYAETALQETKSSALLAGILEREGFAVTRGSGGMPSAFVASAGSGRPVIAILAEYDALPGLSQKAGMAKKAAVVPGAPGHGCGHNLLGTAAVAAAVAANRARLEGRLPGTLRVLGTPAEELLIGKPFMLRDGAFAGVDAVLSWHPSDANYLYSKPRLALTALDIEFFGKTAHAAANPWMGRSSLDAVELLDHAMALMREHVLPTARMHRVVKEGGLVPNVIPDHARVQWWLRDETGDRVNEMAARLGKAAEGSGLATGTAAKLTLLGSTRQPLYNETLSKVIQQHLERVGSPRWDADDQALARAIQKEVGIPETGLSESVLPWGPGHGGMASSDVGEVSAAVPLAELAVQTGPSGAPWHHWDVTTCGGGPIGEKGMMVAAKVLAASLVDLLRDPSASQSARAEFTKATGGKPYVCPLLPGAVPVPY